MLVVQIGGNVDKATRIDDTCNGGIGWRRGKFAQLFGIRLGGDVVSIAAGKIGVNLEEETAFQDVS